MRRPQNIMLPDELIAQARERAQTTQVSLSALVTEALAAYLAVPVAEADKPGPKRVTLTRLEGDIVAVLRKMAMPLPVSGIAYQLGRSDSVIRAGLASMTIRGVTREVPVTESGLRRWTVA